MVAVTQHSACGLPPRPVRVRPGRQQSGQVRAISCWLGCPRCHGQRDGSWLVLCRLCRLPRLDASRSTRSRAEGRRMEAKRAMSERDAIRENELRQTCTQLGTAYMISNPFPPGRVADNSQNPPIILN